MKKLFTSLFALMFTMLTYASTVSELPMMYQVMVTTGQTTPKDVTIEIQLRKTPDGESVWSKSFSFKDVKDKTVENLELDFNTADPAIDWSISDYWLAVIIDGTQVGCSMLTSVPYASYAYASEIAIYIKGGINDKNIIGTWKCQDTNNSAVITYNSDKTFTYVITKQDVTTTTSGTYEVLPNGIIFTIDSTGKGSCDMLVRINDTVITSFGTDGSRLKSFNNDFFTKQE